MKIVIATAVYYPQVNGVAVFAYNLAVGLARRGHEVMVICPSQTGKSYTRTVDGVKTVYLRSVEVKVYPDQIHPVPKQKKVLGVRWPKILYKHGFRVSVFPQIEVRKVLGEFRPDVVHVQVSDPIGLSVVSWARKEGVPVVTTEHNQPEVLTEPLRVPRVLRRGANMMLSAYFRNRQSKSDFVTMPTEKAIRDLLARGKEFTVPVAAVSNGVDLKAFRPGKAKKEIYEKYGLNVSLPTVLYVGRVDPEKKVGLVLEAVKRARERDREEDFDKVKQARMKTPHLQGQEEDFDMVGDLQMVVVGDGVDKARLEKLYRGEPWVHFLGRVVGEDLHELYKVGWVFVTASPIETQGIVLIEAAASGLPLIAVEAGAVEEVCIDGENGYLCRVGDMEGMAGAVWKILSDDKLRERFSRKSVEIASEHDFERTLDKFINIYDKVMQ